MKEFSPTQAELRKFLTADVELHCVTATATEARRLIDVADDDALVSALDNAQGHVFSDETADPAYVLLKITHR